MQEDFGGVFDLSDSQGANASEKMLIELCTTSFLSLWSHPNTYTSEGLRVGQSSGKEFSDVLVVFGRDIIIFSDKHVAFSGEADIAVAWPRWHKKAIQKSIKQLRGARSWLKRFPDQVFLDPQCTRPLPVSVPALDQCRIHLIATTRGTSQHCAEYFKSGSGSLILNSGLELESIGRPFEVGVSRKDFVHVFDEDALSFVMQRLDTAPDLVDYLVAREEALVAQAPLIHCEGEEALLATYLARKLEGRKLNSTEPEMAQPADLLHIQWAVAPEFFNSDEYHRKVQADADSYAWDDQIESFIRIGNPRYGTYEPVPPGSVELALREMASENRFQRRVLVQSFNDMLRVAALTPEQSRTRVLWTKEWPERAYVFACMPCHPSWSRQEYRERRKNFLQAYVFGMPSRAPLARTIVGIAVDHPVRTYRESSEDLIVLETDPLSEEEHATLRAQLDELGIHKWESALQSGQAYDFPGSAVPILQASRANNVEPRSGEGRRKAESDRSRPRCRLRPGSAFYLL